MSSFFICDNFQNSAIKPVNGNFGGCPNEILYGENPKLVLTAEFIANTMAGRNSFHKFRLSDTFGVNFCAKVECVRSHSPKQ